MPHDVFISHSSRDKVAADAACNIIERNGIPCWIAPRDIRPGDDWAEAIVDAIRCSKIFVVIFSLNSNTSKHMRREIERAVHMGIPIIPMRIEDAAPNASLEYFISSHHWLDAFPPPLELHLEKFSHIIRTMLDSINIDQSNIKSINRSENIHSTGGAGCDNKSEAASKFINNTSRDLPRRIRSVIEYTILVLLTIMVVIGFKSTILLSAILAIYFQRYVIFPIMNMFY